jgi:hypothetical protein
MLPEAIVIESLLEARGIRFAVAGMDIASQCPHFVVLFGGISILVDEDDLEIAQALIADGEKVPGYLSLESTNFERRPIRNAVLAFVLLLMGVPFPFWYRGASLRADV